MKVLCFIVHGIGSQHPGFGVKFQRSIDRHLSKLIPKKLKENPPAWKGITQPSDIVQYRELYWANVSQNEQDDLYRTVFPVKYLRHAWVRSLSIRLIGDVFSYLGKSQESIKDAVFRSFTATLKERIDADAKHGFSIVIVGHSLGSVILHDIISGLVRYRYTGMKDLLPCTSVFTMGSPISYFSLITDTLSPTDFLSWTNFYHPRDPIAFPLHKLSESAKDIQINSLAFTPIAAHGSYWHHKTVVATIAEEICCHITRQIAVDPCKLRLPREMPAEVVRPFHGPALTAGFSDYKTDFNKIPFDELIDGATEIDICNVYGGAWYRRYAQYFVDAFKRPGVRVRICMLSPTSPALQGFCHQFSRMPEHKLKENIEDSKRAIKGAFRDANKDGKAAGIFELYQSKNIIHHSFYRFDDLVYFAPRPISSPKNASAPIPTVVFRRTVKRGDDCKNQDKGYLAWIMKDFEALLTTEGDVERDFDTETKTIPASQDVPPPQK